MKKEQDLKSTYLFMYIMLTFQVSFFISIFVEPSSVRCYYVMLRRFQKIIFE